MNEESDFKPTYKITLTCPLVPRLTSHLGAPEETMKEWCETLLKCFHRMLQDFGDSQHIRMVVEEVNHSPESITEKQSNTEE